MGIINFYDNKKIKDCKDVFEIILFFLFMM